VCLPPRTPACLPACLCARAQSIFPELHRSCKAFMRHKDILLSPSVLRTYGVEYMQVRVCVCVCVCVCACVCVSVCVCVHLSGARGLVCLRLQRPQVGRGSTCAGRRSAAARTALLDVRPLRVCHPTPQARQEPNEFVVLNAAAYHAGYNMGFNCAEVRPLAAGSAVRCAAACVWLLWRLCSWAAPSLRARGPASSLCRESCVCPARHAPACD
jgi:hypothetical protein